MFNMAKRLNLDKVQLVELLSNGLELTITPEGDNAIAISMASAEGGQHIGVKQHEDDPNILVIYLKEAKKEVSKRTGFSIV